MRLSTERDRDENGAIAVLHAALDAGVTLLDTADAYCWTDDDRGHNERLIARALRTWQGDRSSSIVVATKGGVTRPGGRWVPNGRAKHLASAAEASCRALGVARIDLYQLHAPDQRVPLSTSVRALADLKRQGLIASVGLCNVTVSQIEEARRIVEIDAIQVEASLWHDEHFLSGVIRYCVDNRLRILAYRPLGGVISRSRTAANPVLSEIAAHYGATPFDVALAWLAGLSEYIVPLPGAMRVDTARAIAQYRTLQLTGGQTARLDELCHLRASDQEQRRPDGSYAAGRRSRADHGAAGSWEVDARPCARGPGLPAIEPRRDRRHAARPCPGVRSGLSVRYGADRSRQHLRVTGIARSGDPSSGRSRCGRLLRMAFDVRR